MKFVAFGDSFTAGYSRSWTFDEAKNISFVNHLKTHTNAFSEYVNLAEVGASNSQIAYKVYDWVKNNDTSDCFIFIGWTTFVRNTAWLNDEYKRSGHSNRFQFFKKIKLENIYLPDSVKRQIFDTERDIFATSKMLELKNIPYCMIQAFDDHKLVNETLIKSDSNFSNWINWNRCNNTMMDICLDRYLENIHHSDYGKNHKEFSSYNLSKLTECLHPNKDGHIQIAKVLIDSILSIHEQTTMRE